MCMCVEYRTVYRRLNSCRRVKCVCKLHHDCGGDGWRERVWRGEDVEFPRGRCVRELVDRRRSKCTDL